MYSVYAGRKKNVWDWRQSLTPALIKSGKEILDKGGLTIDVSADGRGGTAKVGRLTVEAKGLPVTFEQAAERFPWPNHPVMCTCAALAKNQRKCKYVAAFLLAWERDVSPFGFTEPDDVYQGRLDKETRTRVESCLAPLFADLEEVKGRMFHPWLALNVVVASNGEIEGARDIVEHGWAGEPTFALEQDLLRDQRLTVMQPFEDGARALVSVTPAKASVDMDFSCTCATAKALGRYSSKLCRHELVALHGLWEYVVTQDPGDTTNADGLQMMRVMRRMHAFGDGGNASVDTGKERFGLHPQLTVSHWGGTLRFGLSSRAGRSSLCETYRTSSMPSTGRVRFQSRRRARSISRSSRSNPRASGGCASFG